MDAIVSRTLDLGHAVLEFETGYVICRAREGVDLLGEQVTQMFGEIEQIFSGDYGMILDEVNAYSMRFEAMLEFKNKNRIPRMAVVAYRPVTYGTIKMAFYVIKKPYQIFSSLENAKSWMYDQLNQALD